MTVKGGVWFVLGAISLGTFLAVNQSWNTLNSAGLPVAIAVAFILIKYRKK